MWVFPSGICHIFQHLSTVWHCFFYLPSLVLIRWWKLLWLHEFPGGSLPLVTVRAQRMQHFHIRSEIWWSCRRLASISVQCIAPSLKSLGTLALYKSDDDGDYYYVNSLLKWVLWSVPAWATLAWGRGDTPSLVPSCAPVISWIILWYCTLYSCLLHGLYCLVAVVSTLIMKNS